METAENCSRGNAAVLRNAMPFDLKLGLRRTRIRYSRSKAGMRTCSIVQEGHQKPTASNPKKFGICGIRGMDGQSVSTKNWRRTARVFDDVGTRTTSTQDRWSYRHGCSMKNAAGVWRSEVRQESIVRHCSG